MGHYGNQLTAPYPAWTGRARRALHAVILQCLCSPYHSTQGPASYDVQMLVCTAKTLIKTEGGKSSVLLPVSHPVPSTQSKAQPAGSHFRESDDSDERYVGDRSSIVDKSRADSDSDHLHSQKLRYDRRQQARQESFALCLSEHIHDDGKSIFTRN
ncbi:uncharacterized protein EI90DRAFT_3014132 [Cantharellus anzutake]|uniref:uncharacterized protein n=1 Tax=Cantharellus anzutake TaxID=1750568 RepID=UPI001908C5A9|nr:uncharacterized protein EI90DRAFT_3014132 [Cantharellus anzutake]KAF8336348.1 hypothetical protein EI90DRAFT_3014132 [Cantharellus anzutake]